MSEETTNPEESLETPNTEATEVVATEPRLRKHPLHANRKLHMMNLIGPFLTGTNTSTLQQNVNASKRLMTRL